MRSTLSIAALCVCLLGGYAQAMRSSPTRSHNAAAQATGPVDINRASAEELMKVPGMTRVWAGRIIRFRPYHAKNDLLLDGIVPNDVYKRIKDYVVAHRVPY